MGSPLLIFLLCLFTFSLILLPIVHSQQDVNPPPSPPPPPPPPPPLFSPPPPPPPRHHGNRQPPPPRRRHRHAPPPPPPPSKSGLNAGEKMGVLFGGIFVILQVFVAGFLVVTRRRLFRDSRE